MKRHRVIIRVVGLLLLGAVINVAVAWGCAAWSVGAELYDDLSSFGAPRVAAHDRPWLREFEPQHSASGYDWSPGELRAFGFCREAYYWLPNHMFADFSGAGIYGGTGGYSELVGVTKAGWPFLALGSQDIHVDEHESWRRSYSTALVIDINVDIGGPEPMPRPIPLRPLWPGFAVNALLYAGVLWLIFCAPFALRRRLRINRGRCPACAYPIGQSPICTECGSTLVQSRWRRAPLRS